MNKWRNIELKAHRIFFTADHHFDHFNIIKYTNRPFVDTREMEKVLYANWNAVVPKEGLVFVLGDIGFCKAKMRLREILSQLNGEKQLILGNHDNETPEYYLECGFTKVSNYEEIIIGGNKIVLCHYPMFEWNNAYQNSWMLHGHCHGRVNYFDAIRQEVNEVGESFVSRKILDVGVDTHNYTPYSFYEVKTIMESKN